MTKTKNTRREFLRKSAAIGAAFYIIPRHVLGKGYTAPSDRLNIASIGAGGKGRSDITGASNKGRDNIVALCDVDFGMCEESFKNFPNAKRYRDFRVMMDEMGADIDAVTISTPDHTHAVAAMNAIQRGKHVYVQKPMAHNIEEVRTMTEAARKYEVVTQMGNQGASFRGQRQMQDWFDDGRIGPVHTVHVWTDRPVWPQGIPSPDKKQRLPKKMSKQDWDLFIGPAKYVDYHPLYHPFKWRGWWNFGTGALGDMGCHLIDSPFRVLGLGYPTEVECSVGQVFLRDWTPEYIPEGCPPSSAVQFKFPASKKNPVEITLNWSDGGIRPFHPDQIPADHSLGQKDSRNGVLMIGEKGIITCSVYGHNPRLYLNSGEIIDMSQDYPKGQLEDLPEYGHHVYWTNACKAGFDSDEHKDLTSSFEYAGPLTETVLMGNLAVRSYSSIYRPGKENPQRKVFYARKKLLWDAEPMKITNCEASNNFVSRKYRSGWSLGS